MKILSAVLLLLIASWLYVTGCAVDTDQVADADGPAAEGADNGNPIDDESASGIQTPATAGAYTVMDGERGDKSIPVDELSRFARDIVVPRNATEDQIVATMHSALEDFREKHPQADALCIGAFVDESTGVAYAHLYWAADGGKAWGYPSGTVEWQSDRPPAVDEGERFGLTLAERKEAFLDLVAAERRANDEAMARHPEDLVRQAELQGSLMDEYKGSVRTKYAINEEQESQLVVEALEQHWPMY